MDLKRAKFVQKSYGKFTLFQDLSRRTHKGPYGPQPGPAQPGLGPNPARAKAFFFLRQANLVTYPANKSPPSIVFVGSAGVSKNLHFVCVCFPAWCVKGTTIPDNTKGICSDLCLEIFSLHTCEVQGTNESEKGTNLSNKIINFN